MNDIKAFFAEMLADRRARPLDPDVDFLTSLMHGRIDDRPIDHEKFLDICMTLAFGAIDTTKNALGWSLWHLERTPDDRRWVAGDPSIIPARWRSSCAPSRSSIWRARSRATPTFTAAR